MKRRDFLFASAAAMSAASAQEQRPHAMQYHLSPGAIGVRANQQQAIDYASKYGFDCVDADGRYLGSLADGDLDRLLGGMREKKVGWGLAGLPVEFRKDEATFSNGVVALPAYARGLKRAHVERVTTWVLPSDPARTYLENFRTHSKRLRECASILHGEGLRFGLEYVGTHTLLIANRFPFVHTMAEMRELIADINQPNVGLVLDSWHWFNAGDSAKDILGLRASDVVTVDLNDAPAGVSRDQQIDGKRELPAATGVIDVKTFLNSLKEIGFRGPVRVEPFNESVRKMSADEALRVTKDSLDKAFAQIG